MIAARRLAGALSVCLGTLSGCAGDDSPPGPEPTYENVEAVIRLSCAFSSSCHGGPGNGQSMLNFGRHLEAGEPFTLALMDGASPRMACQYDLMPLVDPGNPDNSWLVMKIDGMHTAGQVDFTPDASWDPGIEPDAMGRYPASICPFTEDGAITFGRTMPWSIGMPTPLPAEEIALIRAWIEAGAPGPAGG
jgi:hypothetical protein